MPDKRISFPTFLAFLFALYIALPTTSIAASIVGSKHDLSVSNYYGNTGGGANTTEICVFCHTPHGFNSDLNKDGTSDMEVFRTGGPANAPLWNRRLTSVNGKFTPYTSATMNQNAPHTPSPVSLACLSCHDQVLVIGGSGEVVQDFGAVWPTVTGSSNNEQHKLVNEPNATGDSLPSCGACHPTGGEKPEAWWQIGPDISNEHPVSINYQTTFSTDDNGSQKWFNTPSRGFQLGWTDVRFFNGRVECPTCHNVHDPQYVPFLRKSNEGSALCYTCHNK